MQRHEMTDIVNHSRSTALESSVKILLCVCGGGGGRGGEGGGGAGMEGVLKSILRGHNPRP